MGNGVPNKFIPALPKKLSPDRTRCNRTREVPVVLVDRKCAMDFSETHCRSADRLGDSARSAPSDEIRQREQVQTGEEEECERQ